MRVNNRPSDVIAPRDTSVAFKWLLSRLCLDADVDLWNSIKLHGIPYRSNRVVASRSKHPPDPSLLTPGLFLPRPHGCYCDFLCAVPKERARSQLLFFFPEKTETTEESYSATMLAPVSFKLKISLFESLDISRKGNLIDILPPTRFLSDYPLLENRKIRT